jgi:hypothetical protein
MAEKNRNLAFRVDEATFALWENKRIAQGLSWQELGMALFAEWFSSSSDALIPVSEKHRQLVQEFIRLLSDAEHSEDRHARRAFVGLLRDRLEARKRKE